MGTRLTVDFLVANVQQMARFYEGALGVEPDRQHGHWLPFQLGGATFALHGIDGEPDGDVLHRTNLSFEVDDIEATLARFEALGAKVMRGIADEAFGKSATLQDPEGRQFWLVQPGS